MFKLSNLISRNRASKTKDTLTSDQMANLTVFTQNLNIFDSIKTENEQVRLFETLLSQFKGTFDSISYDQLHNPQVIEALDKYCLICSNVGANIVTNINESKIMFDSILFVFHMLSYLPHDTDFITLFFGVIHEAKRYPEILNPAYDIFTLMFHSQKFYNLFVERDGFTLIFTNFYIRCVSPESQNFFNVLFFESIPKEFHTQYPPQSLLTFFAEVFSKSDIEPPSPACIKFVVNYLIAFHHSADLTLFDRFNDLNGFSILNGYFINNYQTPECVELYKKFLIESQTNPLIVTSLYKLFREKEAKPSFRTLIINLISLSINNVFSFEKFNEVAPIHLWILFPPELDREGYIMLTILLKDLSEKRMYSIKPALDAILKLIQPPGNNIAPIDSFLELIETAIAQRELKPSELLSKKFLEDFILIPSAEDVSRYFEEHPLFGSVVTSVYSSDMTTDYRYPVIQKFIESSQYLKNITDFVEFLEALFTRHFGAETVSLLLNFLNNDVLVDLLVKELTKRSLGYHYFMESNGLLSVEDFLIDESEGENDDLKKGQKVVNLLAAISHFGPKEELNEWINEQPINSPIFKCERSFLKKAIFAFKNNTTIIHIPSFLPFTDDFDTTSMINLYLAGKFGVRAFKKFNKTINQIPNYKLISDRFVYPEDIQTYLRLNERIIDLSVTHYSVFEFVPLLEKCLLLLPFYNFVYFTFFFPHFPSCEIPLVKINKSFSITVESNNLICKSMKNPSDSVSVTITAKRWHKMAFSYKPLMKKITIYINSNKIGTFHLDEEGNPFIFGDDEKPLQSTFIISTNILVSEKPVSNFDFIWRMSSFAQPKEVNLSAAQVKHSESVYLAPYQGLASYFQNFVDLEVIFKRIDETEDQQEFRILLDTVLKISVLNDMNNTLFYDRLMLSFKRQREFIKDVMVDIIYKFPLRYLNKSKKKAKYIQYVLNDIELFHMFSLENLIKLLRSILDDLNSGIELSSGSSSSILQNLICLIRSGLDNQLIIEIIPIISFIITHQPTVSKYRFLLNTAISSSEWNLKNIDCLSLLTKQLPDNKVHYNLLESFIKLAKSCTETELYNYKELLDFMLLFDDDRSLLFADLISIYSKRNPKYISDLNLASFPFTRQCESIGCWIRAFAILSGEIAGDIVPTNLVIQRPIFLPVIIEMLSALCRKAAISALSVNDDEKVNEYLIRQILDIILTLPSDDYRHFLQPCCQIPLMILSNIGLIPKTVQAPPPTYSPPTLIASALSLSPSQSNKALRSTSLPMSSPIRESIQAAQEMRANQPDEEEQQPLQPPLSPQQNPGLPPPIPGGIKINANPSSVSNVSENSEKKRSTMNWFTFTSYRLNRDELKNAFSLCDKVTPFTNQMMENESLTSIQTQPKYYQQVEVCPDNVEGHEWSDQLTFKTSLMNLFSNILFQSEPSNFGTILFDFVIGHSLMYDSYAHYFGQELIFNVIIRMTMSDVPLELYHKPLFRIILKCVKSSLFNDRYTHLLSLIFNMMKSLQVKKQFESILSDPTIMSCYREIILRSFLFVTGNELIELFQLFTTYKTVVFYQPLFANTEFALYWVHIAHFNKLDNQDVIMCLNLLMSMFDYPIMNEYKADEIGEKWKLFKQKIQQSEFESSDYAYRLKRAKSILNYSTNKLVRASKEHLIISIYRVANYYIQTNSQIFSINTRMRSYEMSFYRMDQDARKHYLQNNFICKSFHLSSNPMPLNQSMAVNPSPFEIKSPEFNQKATKEFFMSEKEVYPPRIKQIITDGKMVCAPEWHQFNSHKMMFSSPFEYSQFIANSPILPMLKFAFKSYGPFSTQFNADLFYYTHPIKSVVLVGERALIVIISSQLVSKSTKSNNNNNNNNNNVNNNNNNEINESQSNENNNENLLMSNNSENNDNQENLEIQENQEKNIEDKSSSFIDVDIELIEKPDHPISYVPFAESVTLNEWHHSSLFCGHIALIFDFERIMSVHSYLYLHKNIALNISSLFDPPLLLIFQNQSESETARKLFTKLSSKSIVTQLPAFPFLVTVNSVHKATEMWSNGLLSNYRYLLLLNHFGGRSFFDLGQYPIFPWVVSPSLQSPRDLSLPMGQLDKERAEHYDSTYEDSGNYFYGAHYSQPGIVSWLCLRLPPFIYFQWDLNNGWDNSQRLFVSMNDAFSSASKTNNMDLKELIPAMYTVPEIFSNSSHLVFSSSSIENVSLPDWAGNSPHHYVEMMMKALQSTEKLNEWVDLIFGYKQTGEFAVQAKNLFLPTSYHSATPESLDMDPIVFETQVNNFGQCPIQLFTKPIIPRSCKQLNTIVGIDKAKGFIVESVQAKNKLLQPIPSSATTTSLTYLHSYSSSSLVPIVPSLSAKSSRGFLPKPENSPKLFSSSSYSSTQVQQQTPQDQEQPHNPSILQPDPQNSILIQNSVPTQNSILLQSSVPSQNSSITQNSVPSQNSILTQNSMLTQNSVPVHNLLLSQSAHDFSASSSKAASNENLAATASSATNSIASYSVVSMLSMTNYEHSCYNKSITFCDQGVFMLPGIADAIPPRYSHFISIDSSAANCQLSSVNEKKPLYLITDSEFALSTHLSVSNNGVFVVASFANGFVQVSQIVHLLKKPVSLRFVSSFWLPMSCKCSVLFSIDFVCASLFLTNGKKPSDSNQEEVEVEALNIIYLWNYSTQLLHRIIHPDIQVIGMIADDNEGLLTLYGKNDIVQYTINGEKVRSYHTDYDITILKLYHYNPTFDNCLIVTGDTRGHLTFLSVSDPTATTTTNDNNNEANVIAGDNSMQQQPSNESASSVPWYETFREIGSKAVHRLPIVSLFVSYSRLSIVSVDTRGNSFVTKFNPRGLKVISGSESQVQQQTEMPRPMSQEVIGLSSEKVNKKNITTSFSHSSIERLSPNNSANISTNNSGNIHNEQIEIKSNEPIENENKENKEENETHVKILIDNKIENENGKQNQESKHGSISKSSSAFIYNNFQNLNMQPNTLRCAICENVASQKCKNCGIPLCSSCIDDVTELCPNCAADLSNSLD